MEVAAATMASLANGTEQRSMTRTHIESEKIPYNFASSEEQGPHRLSSPPGALALRQLLAASVWGCGSAPEALERPAWIFPCRHGKPTEADKGTRLQFLKKALLKGASG